MIWDANQIANEKLKREAIEKFTYQQILSEDHRKQIITPAKISDDDLKETIYKLLECLT